MLKEIVLPLDPSASVDTIAVMQWGKPNGLPILLVHGWLDNAASFLPLSDELIEYNCIAIDLPGHGLSSHKTTHYHFIDWVDDLYQIINGLYQHHLIAPEHQRLVLMGHSLGALISSVFAATFPEKIHKLIMIEGLGPLCAPLEQSVKHLRRTIMTRVRANNKHKRVYSSMASAVQAWQVLSELSHEHARLIVKRNLNKTEQGWQWQYDQVLRHRSPLRMLESQARYFSQQITCSALLLKAKQDSFIDDKQLEERKTWFQDLTISVLGQGHHLHMGSAKLVAEAIHAFI